MGRIEIEPSLAERRDVSPDGLTWTFIIRSGVRFQDGALLDAEAVRAAFRRQMIELVRRGRTPEELADEFEPSAQAIRNWVKQAALDAGQRTDGLTTEEREELRRLRRENRQLREERAILSKAAAWFARETNAIPSKDSSS